MISRQWAHEPFHQFFERLQEALAIPSEDDIACTALHLAVLYGTLECCMLLLMRRPFIEDKDNRNRDQVCSQCCLVNCPFVHRRDRSCYRRLPLSFFVWLSVPFVVGFLLHLSLSLCRSVGDAAQNPQDDRRQAAADRGRAVCTCASASTGARERARGVRRAAARRDPRRSVQSAVAGPRYSRAATARGVDDPGCRAALHPVRHARLQVRAAEGVPGVHEAQRAAGRCR